MAGVNLAIDKLRRGTDAAWSKPAAGTNYYKRLCRSGCDVNDPNLPTQINSVQIYVYGRGGVCQPPAGVNWCIRAIVDYTPS
jgi:hypothetical protein